MEQREKKEKKNKVIITTVGGIRGNIQRRVEEWLEREIIISRRKEKVRGCI
jgi:hypothetical protein